VKQSTRVDSQEEGEDGCVIRKRVDEGHSRGK
jgi:hypothetical protein